MAQLPLTVPQSLTAPGRFTRDQQDVLDTVSGWIQSLTQIMLEGHRRANGELGFGHPAGDELVDTAFPAFIDNMRGSWTTLKFTATSDLGAAITINHNLDISTTTLTTPGGTTTPPNVRWILDNWIYGDKTETVPGTPTIGNNAPSGLGSISGVNQQTGQIWFQMGDTVTNNSIQLRFHSSITPQTATPLYVDFLIIPAVR